MILEGLSEWILLSITRKRSILPQPSGQGPIYPWIERTLECLQAERCYHVRLALSIPDITGIYGEPSIGLVVVLPLLVVDRYTPLYLPSHLTTLHYLLAER